ncbi:hypothetical protein DSL72_002853 [Monilinia vaccinii-corymbosi]|uniref:Uncharacterized protein n=1 Tax=Monilinia vaccinii-corymbosi TaxID=61207 RepID=A0A8A3PDV3_9HELO|nr:hypothetical protein DSL72_002853 [Monilinia vaccinii-corymbosi]
MSNSELVQQPGRMDSDGDSPRVAPSQSASSEGSSTASASTALRSPPLSISPEPVFIAHSAASQIVTNDHDVRADARLDQHGIEPSGETALVSPAALKLVNQFLDQLVFNFLSVSKSTSLVSLRPAVSEVLKSKLARDAVSGADNELREYLGGGEDDELLSSEREGLSSRDWDLELVWKRTRLRCMVYSSLGDMEEEDEHRYTAQEHLNGPLESGIVSPAVAIFLTSILEFMGEKILLVAGNAAYERLRMKHEKEERNGTTGQTDIAERVVVEEADIERVAFDRTLGELWRGWKRRGRSPRGSLSMARSNSREITDNPAQPIVALTQVASVSPVDGGQPPKSALDRLAEHEQAASIPLPMSVDDVREIEVPGLASQSDDEDYDVTSEAGELPFTRRPKSMVIFTSASHNLPTPSSSQPATPIFSVSPWKSRKRANSLPPPNPSNLTCIFSQGSHEVISNQEDAASSTQSGAPGLDGTITPAESEKGAGEEVEEVSDQAKTTESESEHEPANGPMDLDNASQDVDSDYEFIEEPQIMTSSRISFGGRVSPDDRDSSPRSSPQSSVRPPSIRSLRLIDVNISKSPTTGSRQSSSEATDHVPGRGVSMSRPSSLHSPILSELSSRGTSPHFRSSNSFPLARTGPNLSPTPINTTTDSISEVDEGEAAGDESPLTAVPSELAAAMQGVDVDPCPTSQNYPTFKPAASRSTPFVLAAPPTPQNYRENMKGLARQQADKGELSSGRSNHKVREGEKDTQSTQQGVKGSSEPPHRSTSRTGGNPVNESLPILRILNESGSPETSKTIPHPSSLRRNSSSRPVGEEVSSRKATPETQSKVLRPTYTINPSSPSFPHIKQRRVSEESGVSAMSSVGDAKSFDELIRGDETLQYTLTPQNMRAIESPDSPLSMNAIPVPRSAPSRTHSSSVSKHTGLHSHPPSDSPRNISLKASSRPSANNSRVRPSVPQPRDARVDRDSLGDFSDFIRSTGPAISYKEEVHSRTSSSAASEITRPLTGGNSHKGTNGIPRNFSSSIPRVNPVAALPTRSASAAGRSGRLNKLQPRDATVGKDSITDLIDFVRAGPDEIGSHRIPRTVAPFRSTMDSDQMSHFAGGKAIDASLPDGRYSQASTQASTNHSSVTSQTGLLNNSIRADKSTPSTLNFDDDDDGDEDMMPKRKTRRPRDPYAIDFSDEENDELEPPSRPAPIKEESLADFLRNVSPPPSPKMTSVFVEVSKPPKKKASFSSRFTRSGSTSQVQQPKLSNSATSRTIPTKYTPFGTSNSQFNASDVGGGYGNYSQQPEPPKATNSREPVPVKFVSQTTELANFLRNSESPPSIEPKQSVHAKEETKFASRFFGRRKKSTAGF